MVELPQVMGGSLCLYDGYTCLLMYRTLLLFSLCPYESGNYINIWLPKVYMTSLLYCE